MKTINKWHELNDDERDKFVDDFYLIWSQEVDYSSNDLGDNPNPWGMPWYWAENDEVVSARQHFEKFKCFFIVDSE